MKFFSSVTIVPSCFIQEPPDDISLPCKWKCRIDFLEIQSRSITELFLVPARGFAEVVLLFVSIAAVERLNNESYERWYPRRELFSAGTSIFHRTACGNERGYLRSWLRSSEFIAQSFTRLRRNVYTRKNAETWSSRIIRKKFAFCSNLHRRICT